MVRPHIVLICLDTVRKDFYDTYAPRLQERSTISFEQMRAAASWSVPSHAAMLTGQLPHQTGIHAYNRDFSTLSTAETWIDDLPEYRTACVSSNIYASPAFGFDTLFDSCMGISPSRRYPKGIDLDEHIRNRDDDDGMVSFIQTALTHDHPLQSVANGALFKLHDISQRFPIEQPFDFGAKSVAREIRTELLDATDPTFLFANFMDAHGPHSPFQALDDELYSCSPSFTSLSFQDWDVNTASELTEFEEQIEIVRQLYAAEIDYLDRVISDLIDTITERVNRETIFIVTADHGENLAYESDEYLLNHVSSLSEGLLHVPFDICAPSQAEIVTDRASHLDLGEIVVRLSNGESVSDITRDQVVAEIAGSGSGTPDEDTAYWDRAQRAVYRDSHKYIRDNLGETTVYNIDGSASTQRPCSETDVPSEIFEQVFADTIDKFARGAEAETTDIEIDDATKSRLEELGYL